MATDRCPDCNARLLPGDVACASCGFDLIMGRKPGERSSRDQARLAVQAGLSAVALLLLFAGAWMLVSASSNQPAEEAEACMRVLQTVQPKVLERSNAGVQIPRCGRTPPGPTDCWSLAGVGAADLPRGDDLWLSLKGYSGGFEITCRSDEDGDAQWALFQANEHVQGLRISRAEVR